MATEHQFRENPCFVISVAARMVGVHAQTLRYYEKVSLISPSRTEGRQRLFSMADIERLHRIKTLTEDMGVNLAGAEVALKLMNRIEQLESDVQTLTNEVTRLRDRNGPSNRRRGPNQVV
ncbi:MAG TPA: MerR family transcriptional regulator [Dehalococcoidia bacterium]|jgi:MerR family transcriptional regulator/heat shock protein HspR|nr:MerR family transcriptional regulator [Dehalococcoidia bacterium]|tara:strand:- start:184 stop:543 length:360 start_codon:yes stop_codon:yes gene_type:complete